MRLLRILFLAWIASTACVGFAQSDNDSGSQDDTTLPRKPAPCTPERKLYQSHIIYKDKPYSGVRISTCEKKEQDGTVFKATMKFWEYRDAQGRFRLDEESVIPSERNRHSVSVVDPVRHLLWSWWEGPGEDHAAVKTSYKPSNDTVAQEPTRHVLPDGNLDPPIFAHMLKMDTPTFKQIVPKPTYINGVWAEGNRLIQIVSPGIGNNKSDHKEIVTDESWISTDLMVEVRKISDDPELGKSTVNLVNIDRAEPDPALFRPPADYRILVSQPVDLRKGGPRFIVVPAKPQDTPAEPQ